MLMARILVVAVFLLTTSAFGQSSPGGTPGEFPEQLNLDAFWEQAFELDDVEGASAIVLGDELAGGSTEVWVLDPNNLGDPEDLLLQPGGHLNPHIEHQLDWIEPVGPRGIAGCCVVGGVIGVIWGYNSCIDAALRDYQTAVDNAKALYIACMKNCGYVIAQE